MDDDSNMAWIPQCSDGRFDDYDELIASKKQELWMPLHVVPYRQVKARGYKTDGV